MIKPAGTADSGVKSEDFFNALIVRLTGSRTTSGEKRDDLMKKLRQHCKEDDRNLPLIFDALMDRLFCDHATIRLNVLDVIADFFQRSHLFRTLLTDQFERFLRDTIETDVVRFALPPPKESAKLLRSRTLALYKEWCEKYGSVYAKLDLAKKYLETSLKTRLQEVTLERRQKEASDAKQATLNAEAERKVESLFRDKFPEIESALSGIESCFDLLFPDLSTSSSILPNTLDSQDSSLANSDAVRLAAHGFPSGSVGSQANVSIELSLDLGKPLEQNFDNQPIVDQIVDYEKLICHRYLPFINKLIKRVTPLKTNGNLLKELLDGKARLSTVISKCRELRIVPENRHKAMNRQSDEQDDDEDFVDVPEKEGFEAAAILDEPGQSQAESEHCNSVTVELDLSDDAATACESSTSSANGERSKVIRSRPKGQTNNEKSGTEEVPIVPYGLDLKYWEAKRIEPADVPRNNADCHRFWRPNADEAGGEFSMASDLAVESYRSRLITFVGNEAPIEHQCLAPLATGKGLCQRMDRRKCPFHGIIVPRDPQTGQPLSEMKGAEEASSSKRTKRSEDREKTPQAIPDWQNPELLAEIKAATGRDLTVGKGNGKQETFIKVSDARAPQDARARLRKKLFNRSANARQRRSAAQLESKKFNEKFAAFWQYSMS